MFTKRPLLLFFGTSFVFACRSDDAIKQGTCSETDNDLFAVCIDAGCSAAMANSAEGIDECDAEAESGFFSTSGGVECTLSGSGSCVILCDCSALVGGGDGSDGSDADVVDGDGDGIPVEDDCNDQDPSMPANDADCDGIETVGDCDDADPSSPAIADDADCDGVPTEEDCDDSDPALLSLTDDHDCDGVPTIDDCDDTDPTKPNSDADCDGYLTTEDCDDTDATIPESVDDLDCDDMPTHAGGGNMIRITAGSFDMGCTPGQSDCDDDELPVMPVTLTHDYYIGETEVTQAGYLAITGTNPSSHLACGMDCPVERVTWHNAAAFANALSAASGLAECYSCTGSGTATSCVVATSPYRCHGYRLPTEAEWEGAARCGEDTLYAGSNAVTDVAWHTTNSDGAPHPVATKRPNTCDLYDMSGNVWEWIHDWYDPAYYSSSGRVDPEGPSTGVEKSNRGGGCCDNPVQQRVANRYMYGPFDVRSGLGFRIARTIP